MSRRDGTPEPMYPAMTFATIDSAALAPGGICVMHIPPADDAISDPLLAFISEWNAADRAAEAASTEKEGDAHFERQRRCCLRAQHGDIPVATTAKGAAAALRRILAMEDSEAQDTYLIRAALAFLEKEA